MSDEAHVWPPHLPTSVVLAKRNEEVLPRPFEAEDVRFAEPLVELFVEALTKPGDVVLDPFCGFGTTLIVAGRLRREAWGVEIDPTRADYARSRQRHPDRLLTGDARTLNTLRLPPARLLLTSPPYSSPGEPRNALSGYVDAHRGYSAYLDDLSSVFAEARRSMLPDGWIVIEASNLKHTDGTVTMLAWDIARSVNRVARFMGEVVVTWKPTYGYGYDHSYCLVFSCS